MTVSFHKNALKESVKEECSQKTGDGKSKFKSKGQ